MNTITKITAAGILALSATAAAADISGGVLMDLNVNALPVTCAFTNPVTGSMDYDPAFERFDSATGTPAAAEIDLTYRNLATLNVSNSGFFDGNAGGITSVLYGTNTLFKTVAITDNGDLTGSWTLTPSETEATDTISVLPNIITVPASAISATGTVSTTFVISCVE